MTLGDGLIKLVAQIASRELSVSARHISARVSAFHAVELDLIENIAKRIADVLPRYGNTFWALLRHPIAEVVPRSRDGVLIWDAVLFWAVSMAIFQLTRFIAFSPDADPVLFFVAAGISSVVQLLLVSMAFFCIWRLFGAQYNLGSFIIATACIHGVVLPLESVSGIGLFGITRIIDDDLFHLMTNSFNGCGQVMTLPELNSSVEALLLGASAQKLWLAFLYFLMTFIYLGLLIGYTVAYMRVLAQLAVGRAQFGFAKITVMLVLGGTLAITGLTFNALFNWALYSDPGLCLQTSES